MAYLKSDQILSKCEDRRHKNDTKHQKNEESEEFDYSLLPGDAIIFNEGGIHKGSKSLINERFVLRYLYSIKKN